MLGSRSSSWRCDAATLGLEVHGSFPAGRPRPAQRVQARGCRCHPAGARSCRREDGRPGL